MAVGAQQAVVAEAAVGVAKGVAMVALQAVAEQEEAVTEWARWVVVAPLGLEAAVLAMVE